MGDIHILVVESDTPEIVARFRAQGRLSEADNFAEVLHQIDTSIHTSIIAPYAGECCTAQFLAGVSGVCFTGSCVDWCVDDMRAAALESTMRTVFEAGVPVYGSCNGLQMAVHVLGGTLRASPAGREDGIARNVTLSPAAHSHPMMRGRDAVYTAVCVHRDEVHTPPPGAVVLAGNEHSAVQAMVFEQEQVCFWGTQYVPPFVCLCVCVCVRVGGWPSSSAGPLSRYLSLSLTL